MGGDPPEGHVVLTRRTSQTNKSGKLWSEMAGSSWSIISLWFKSIFVFYFQLTAVSLNEA